MINYNKNDLMEECLDRYYGTFMRTLDTVDYVPEKYNEKILKYIFKNMKKQFGRLNAEDRQFRWDLFWKTWKENRQAKKAAKEREKLEKPLRKFNYKQARKAARREAKAALKKARAAARQAKKTARIAAKKARGEAKK